MLPALDAPFATREQWNGRVVGCRRVLRRCGIRCTRGCCTLVGSTDFCLRLPSGFSLRRAVGSIMGVWVRGVFPALDMVSRTSERRIRGTVQVHDEWSLRKWHHLVLGQRSLADRKPGAGRTSAQPTRLVDSSSRATCRMTAYRNSARSQPRSARPAGPPHRAAPIGRFSIGAIERSPVPVALADKALPITPAVSARRRGAV